MNHVFSEEEYIDKVVKKCYKRLSKKDKEQFRKEPDSGLYHISYGMYIRNKYYHKCKNSMVKRMILSPDVFSDDVIKRLIEVVLSEK